MTLKHKTIIKIMKKPTKKNKIKEDGENKDDDYKDNEKDC